MRKSAKKPLIYQHSVNFIICSPSQPAEVSFSEIVETRMRKPLLTYCRHVNKRWNRF